MAAVPSSRPAAPRAASAWPSDPSLRTRFAGKQFSGKRVGGLRRLPSQSLCHVLACEGCIAMGPGLSSLLVAPAAMTAGDLDSSLLGRIVRPADYVRVLATPMRLRSPHFAVHHLAGRPLPLKRPTPSGLSAALVEPISAESQQGHAPVTGSLSTELSTSSTVIVIEHVDDSVETPVAPHGPLRWVGLVVPKRHAKRAVTRTLIKRQIRNVAAACSAQLEPGLWVVRQRSPFDPKQYPSAASDALKEAARAELRALFERAVRGERDRFKPRPPGDGKAPRSGSRKSPKPAAAGDPPCAA